MDDKIYFKIKIIGDITVTIVSIVIILQTLRIRKREQNVIKAKLTFSGRI